MVGKNAAMPPAQQQQRTVALRPASTRGNLPRACTLAPLRPSLPPFGASSRLLWQTAFVERRITLTLMTATVGGALRTGAAHEAPAGRQNAAARRKRPTNLEIASDDEGAAEDTNSPASANHNK